MSFWESGTPLCSVRWDFRVLAALEWISEQIRIQLVHSPERGWVWGVVYALLTGDFFIFRESFLDSKCLYIVAF